MSYYVRLMHWGDVTQVTGIDREAFPSLIPPPNYRHELENRLAHYIVACDDSRTAEEPEIITVPDKRFSGLLSRVKHFLGGAHVPDRASSASNEYIIGFAGFWTMADEAHLINIAVRNEYRHRGIGELLLIATIELAIEINARLVNLEVRASNTAALNLYHKYGFTQVGLRRGYYTDDREDAALMTVENVDSDLFQARFQQLKKAHSKKVKIGKCQIVSQV